VILAGFVAPAAAADLSKVERTIAKEPAYQTKSPKYCLLAFGPEAKHRVWMVWDGDALYVDRNGNGDLTDPGEKFVPKKAHDGYTFEAGEIRDGNLRHVGLTVSMMPLENYGPGVTGTADAKAILARDPKAMAYGIAIEMEMPGRKGIGVGGRVVQLVHILDANGVFQFADKPADAPIVHFGGPWQVTLFGDPTELRLGRENELILGVGTPGLGRGTFAYVGYENLMPEGSNPTAEITYPLKNPDDTPVKELFELKHRC
jgi:hypothetical protein